MPGSDIIREGAGIRAFPAFFYIREAGGPLARAKKKKLDFSEKTEVTLGDFLGIPVESEQQKHPADQGRRQKSDEGIGLEDADRKARIVLRRERKGRKGKTVTVVEGVVLSSPALKETARRMRRELGCGSHVEDDKVVLQGDQRERASLWLKRQGFRNVVDGG